VAFPSATPYCGKIEQIEQERREKAKNHHLEKRSKKGLCKKWDPYNALPLTRQM
jgi:hypothetical protein